MMSTIKINDQNLLNYSLNRIYEKQDVNIEEFLRTKEFITFGQYLGAEPYWVVSIYDFTTHGDCMLDIVLNHKGLLSVDTMRRIAYLIADYVFYQNKCIRASTMVKASNTKSIRITKAFGFKVEGIVRNGYNKPIVEDKILFGMLKDECPWINGDNK